jgi:hypothetical protein
LIIVLLSLFNLIVINENYKIIFNNIYIDNFSS